MQNAWFLQCSGAGDSSGDSWYYNKKEVFYSLIQLSPELSPAPERWKNVAFCMVFVRRESVIGHPTIPRMRIASSSTVPLWTRAGVAQLRVDRFCFQN